MQPEQNINIKIALWPPLIIGVAILLSTIVGAFAFYKVRAFDDSLSVTGSAKQEIISDTVRWNASFTREVRLSNLTSGYAQMAIDEKKVKDFLLSKGLMEEDITIAPISMDEIYDYNQNGQQTEKRYNLRGQVTVNTAEVDKVTAAAKDNQALIGQGVIFSTGNIEYLYSKLPELRVTLLADAVKDAKARADKIAEASGKSVGQLKSASSGVVQVLPLNSVDVNDYGAYATGEIKKEVMVTVKAAFTLR